VHAGDSAVVVRLERRVKLEGRVFDGRGAPIAEARVTAWPACSPWIEVQHTSSALGAFAFDELAPGENLFVATTSDDRIGVARVRLDRSEAATPIELRVAAGAIVNLRVPPSIAVARWEVRTGDLPIAAGFAHQGESKRVVVPTGKLTLAFTIAGVEHTRELELAAGETKSAILEP
jgi:hypothetical protein